MSCSPQQIILHLSSIVKQYIRESSEGNGMETCTLAIHTPSNTDWTKDIECALKHHSWKSKRIYMKHSPSANVLQVGGRLPYKRKISKYQYFTDIGCTCTLMEKVHMKEYSALLAKAPDLIHGRFNKWVTTSNQIMGVLLYSSLGAEDECQPTESTSQSLHGWCHGDISDPHISDGTSKVFITFARDVVLASDLRTIADAIENVWRIIFNSVHLYTMQEATEMLSFLPQSQRRYALLKQCAVSASSSFLDGYVARPALTKRTTMRYLMKTDAGLWLYTVKSKTLDLLRRDLPGEPLFLHTSSRQGASFQHRLSSMMRLPVLVYSFSDYACLDPLVPHDCEEVRRLLDERGGNRVVYDLTILSGLLDEAAVCMKQNLSIGPIWKFGSVPDTGRMYINSEEELTSKSSSVNYRTYYNRKSMLTTHLNLTGLALLSADDPFTEFISDRDLDFERFAFTTEGILCTLEFVKQSDLSYYKRHISSRDNTLVAYRGTAMFPFHLLKGLDGLHSTTVYEAIICVTPSFDTLVMRNLSVLGSLHNHDYTVELTLAEVMENWQSMTHPTWPLLSPTSTLCRWGCSVWSALSECLHLEEEGRSVLIIHQYLDAFGHTFSCLPASWKVVAVNLGRGHAHRTFSNVTEVPYDNVASLLGISFDYVVLAFCNMTLNSLDADALHQVFKDLARMARRIVMFNFDRSMILEFPFNFRYIFGTVKLSTYRTESKDMQVWEYVTETGGSIVDVPLDMDEVCSLMHEVTFVPSQTVTIAHLSKFIPRTPGVGHSYLPEKLQLRICFERRSKCSPLMVTIVSKREVSAFEDSSVRWLHCAQVGSSHFYLLDNPKCTASILHAIFQSCTKSYWDCKSPEDRVQLVKDYQMSLKALAGTKPQSVLKLGKGVLFQKPQALEVCILSIHPGGVVASTIIPHSADQSRTQNPTNDLCVVVLRVAENIAYPVAMQVSNGYRLIHKLSEVNLLAQSISLMVQDMVGMQAP